MVNNSGKLAELLDHGAGATFMAVSSFYTVPQKNASTLKRYSLKL